MNLLELADPGQNCEGIKFYAAKKTLMVSNLVQNGNLTLRVNHLVWLKNAFPLYQLSRLFKISLSTVLHHLLFWVNFLYFKLGSVPTWPLKAEILEIILISFYIITRCIIECTELFCLSPSLLNTRNCL